MSKYQLHVGRWRQRGQAGFTLVEVLVVIVLLGILTFMAVPQYTSMGETAALQTDLANLRILNGLSTLYQLQQGKPLAPESVTQPEPALDLQTNTLVGDYLSAPVEAQRADQHFYWFFDGDQGRGRWMYSLYQLADPSSGRYQFDSMTSEQFEDIAARYGQSGGAWNLVDGHGLSSSGSPADLLFVPNNRSEYTINTRFELGPQSGSNYGGIGILFESTISNGNSQGHHYDDTGYILQFDRHFGQIIIRPRTDGGEGNPWVRVGPEDTNNAIPDRDDAWWTTEKEISMDVRKDSENRVVLTVRITDVATGDTIVVLDEYSHESMLGVADPANNFTGFRGWHGVPADFYDLEIR